MPEITFTAGQRVTVPGGNFLKLRDTVYPVTVEFYRAKAELRSERAENVEAGYGANPEPPRIVGPSGATQPAFDYAIIESEAVQTIKVYVTKGRVDDDRTSGTVNVVDGGKAITLAERAFFGSIVANANAVEYGHGQLLNPAGNTGRRAVVNLVTASPELAMSVGLKLYDTPLTDTETIRQKLPGSVVTSTMEMRYDTYGSVLGDRYDSVYIEANTSHIFEMSEPIILLPGKGIIVAAAAVSATLRAGFQFHEEVY